MDPTGVCASDRGTVGTWLPSELKCLGLGAWVQSQLLPGIAPLPQMLSLAWGCCLRAR